MPERLAIIYTQVHFYYKKEYTAEITCLRSVCLSAFSSDLELECEGLLEEEEFNGSMEPEEVRFLEPCSLSPYF